MRSLTICKSNLVDATETTKNVISEVQHQEISLFLTSKKKAVRNKTAFFEQLKMYLIEKIRKDHEFQETEQQMI